MSDNLPVDSVRAAVANLLLGKDDGDLSISIDFGTSYSSVSWIKGTTLDIKDIGDIAGWASAHSVGPYSSVPEVPSEWMYRNGVKKYGYEVHHILSRPGHEEWHRLTNIKMLLDSSADSYEIRRQNLETIKRINETRADHEKIGIYDIIVDYLFFLLSRTKAQLSKKNIRGKSHYTPGDPVKFVLSIPEKWDAVAKWTMEKALATVTEILQFGSTADLFMLSESESASTYMLERLRSAWSSKSETIITVDAGGGTTDVATFSVINDKPLRFRRVGISQAHSIGSSFLDHRFREYLEDRVKEQTHLNEVENGSTLVELIDAAVIYFHRQMKRYFQGDLEEEVQYVDFNGLAACKEKGFARGRVVVTQSDLAKIFDPVCDAIWEMVEDQILSAQKSRHVPSKMLLVGGLGLSIYLQKFIEVRLASRYPDIELVPIGELPEASLATVVSRGSLFRSLNKEVGPTRINNTGFGISQNQIFRPDFEGHQGGDPFIDEVDHETYVTCIYYLCKPEKDIRSETHKMWETLLPGQNFDVRIPIYMGDGYCVDDYHIDHQKNATAQQLGELSFKTTFDEIKQNATPGSFKKKNGYYLVTYDVIIQMHGLRMEYGMRFPSGPKGKLRAKGELQNIAAAFNLGAA
ncbi:hypothetical protein LHYA1_G002489 [Lachnellula hyalina]|uniref:Heat shock 70 kDa protein 12A n=1 Tax=Lachnellula hyalina TaxID=1316788 RepID=A0A8H8R7N3_9HELO|nr:uncharacterized protein LHYA1_G002489 [Lachnellula hyalina]TVY29121.1 hypothetical protein LHYA1_G002489 [Lachnellula hyalina]